MSLLILSSLLISGNFTQFLQDQQDKLIQVQIGIESALAYGIDEYVQIAPGEMISCMQMEQDSLEIDPDLECYCRGLNRIMKRLNESMKFLGREIDRLKVRIRRRGGK